jgi:hypothetical protein
MVWGCKPALKEFGVRLLWLGVRIRSLLAIERVLGASYRPLSRRCP